MEVNTITRKKYRLVWEMSGGIATGWSTKVHSTFEDAVKEYENRLEDIPAGYREYWLSKPLIIDVTTEVITTIMAN